MSIEQTKISWPHPPKNSDCYRILIKVNRSDIVYIVSTIEAYDNIGIPRTIDKLEGIVEILVAPDFLHDARKLISSFEKEMNIEVIRV